MIYKIAKLVPTIDFEDFFTSQEDLQLIVENLPAQQYLYIFNAFGQNYHSRKVDEAVFKKKKGVVEQLKVFI